MKNLVCIFIVTVMAGAFSRLNAQVTDDSIYTPKNYKEEASFPGGTEAWINHLNNYLDPSTPILNGAPAGNYTVVVKFIVMKDGTLRQFVPETNIGYGMETEVIRVIKSSPKWMPAQKDGLPVNAYRMQPVTFVVQKPGRIRNKD